MMEAVFTLVEETKRIFDEINLAVMAIIVIREELRQRGLKPHIPKQTVEWGRRLWSCSRDLLWATKAAFLTVFSIQMMESGKKKTSQTGLSPRWWPNPWIP